MISAINWSDVIAAVVIGLIGNGFLGTYLLQRYKGQQDRELEGFKSDLERKQTEVKSQLEGDIRALQAGLDRIVFVHRTQFETEFAATRDIWKAVAAVRRTMGKVRPEAEIVPMDETADQRRDRESKRFTEFVAALNDLRHAADNQSPFVPPNIFKAIEEVIAPADKEAVDVTLHRAPHEANPEADWHERGIRNYKAVCVAAEQLSNRIRERLSALAVLPGETRL